MGDLENSELLGKYHRKKITHVKFRHEDDDEVYTDEIILTFEDNTKIVILDTGQQCCESRYITCEDELRDLINGELLNIECVATEENIDDENDHEICFVNIETTNGRVQLATHNVHNGYYSGFNLKIEER